MGPEPAIRRAAQPRRLAQAFVIGGPFRQLPPAPWCWATTSSTATTSTNCWATPCSANKAPAVFAYHVRPRRYGVAGVRCPGQSAEPGRKAGSPKSSYAVTGPDLEPPVPQSKASSTSKSWARGCAWLDTGTHESLLRTRASASPPEQRQGPKDRPARKRSRGVMGLGLTQLSSKLASRSPKNGMGSTCKIDCRKEKVYRCAPPAIPDVVLIEPKGFGDAEAFLRKLQPEVALTRLPAPATSSCGDNHSRSSKEYCGLHLSIWKPQVTGAWRAGGCGRGGRSTSAKTHPLSGQWRRRTE